MQNYEHNNDNNNYQYDNNNIKVGLILFEHSDYYFHYNELTKYLSTSLHTFQCSVTSFGHNSYVSSIIQEIFVRTQHKIIVVNVYLKSLDNIYNQLSILHYFLSICSEYNKKCLMLTLYVETDNSMWTYLYLQFQYYQIYSKIKSLCTKSFQVYIHFT